MASKYKSPGLKFNGKSGGKGRKKKSPVFIRKQSNISFAESEYFSRFYFFFVLQLAFTH